MKKTSPHLPRARAVRQLLEDNDLHVAWFDRRTNDYRIKVNGVSLWRVKGLTKRVKGVPYINEPKSTDYISNILKGVPGIQVYYKNGYMQVIVEDLMVP